MFQKSRILHFSKLETHRHTSVVSQFVCIAGHVAGFKLGSKQGKLYAIFGMEPPRRLGDRSQDGDYDAF